MARGRKTGGRKAGTPNRSTVLKRQALQAAAANDGSPLGFLISVMHSPHVDARLRLDAAKAAAQYLHKKPKDAQPGDAAKVIESVEATAEKAEAERLANILAAKYGLDDDLDDHCTGLPQDEHGEPPPRANPTKNP